MNIPPERPENPESGNVIFFIFIGIVLFAALSFAFGGMNRGSGNNANKELFQLYASEVLQYARGLRTAVQGMKINGVAETQISFENNVVTGYDNPTCTEDHCRVFAADGGGVTYSVPETAWLDPSLVGQTGYGEWYFIGESCVYDVGTGSTDCYSANGATDSDLIMVLPWVKEDLCITLNDNLGITNPGGQPPQIQNQAFTGSMPKFTGTYSEGGHAIQSDSSGTAILQAKRAGCFMGENFPPAGSYTFYQVLLAR